MGSASVRGGQEGETLAAGWLEAQGFVILRRNFRADSGELDLVVEKGGVVYFVEVKTRRRGGMVAPELAVTADKRRRLARAARAWLMQNASEDAACSFLLVTVTTDSGGEPQFAMIEDFLQW